MSTSWSAKCRVRFACAAAGFGDGFDDAGDAAGEALAGVLAAVCPAGGRTIGGWEAGCWPLIVAEPNGTSCWMLAPRTCCEFVSGDAGVRFSYAPHPTAARMAMHAAATNARFITRLL